MAAEVRRLRLRLGLTQGAFAKRLGITQNYLSYIESGERALTPELSRRISAKFKTTIEKEIQSLQIEIDMLKRLRQ